MIRCHFIVILLITYYSCVDGFSKYSSTFSRRIRNHHLYSVVGTNDDLPSYPVDESSFSSSAASSSSSSSLASTSSSGDNENDVINPVVQLNVEVDRSLIEDETKKEALHLLDCMTCPIDEDDPAYDVELDIMRDEILMNNDYESLKVELRARKLRTSGDKTEMIIRMLLHIIDPTMDFAQSSGLEPNLKYITDEDVKSGNVTMIPEEQRSKLKLKDLGPDAADLMVLKKTGNQKEDKKREKDLIVLDGLTRRELEYMPLEIIRDSKTAKIQDETRTVRAYVVGGRDVLRSWEYSSTVIISLPDEYGWRDPKNRVFADELAFFNQAIVIVPDIHSGNAYNDKEGNLPEWFTTSTTDRQMNRAIDDVIASMQFAQEQYEPQTICLAGAGHGGGLALSTSAFFGKLDKAYKPSANGLSSQEIIIDDSNEDYQKEVLDARQAVIATNMGLISEGCILSMQQLQLIQPKGVYAATPTFFDTSDVGESINCACFVTFGEIEDPLIPGSGLNEANNLYTQLNQRRNEVADFGIRVYSNRKDNFVHRPQDDDDSKCAQESTGIGAIWLDIYARNSSDATMGIGTNKDSESAFVKIPVESLINPLRDSVVATYVHDDPDFVRNTRLENDARLKAAERAASDEDDGTGDINIHLGKSLLERDK